MIDQGYLQVQVRHLLLIKAKFSSNVLYILSKHFIILNNHNLGSTS